MDSLSETTLYCKTSQTVRFIDNDHSKLIIDGVLNLSNYPIIYSIRNFQSDKNINSLDYTYLASVFFVKIFILTPPFLRKFSVLLLTNPD